MTEELNQSSQASETTSREQEEPFGGEIRVRGGDAPRFMRWVAYILFVWAIVYLVIHPPVEHRVILWILVGLLSAWLLFFALTKRPPEP